MIAEIMKYLVISGFIIGFSFLIRNFMVNHYPMRLNRNWYAAKSNDLLDFSEELEIPMEKESSPNPEQWIRKARKSPLETAMVIRQWLEEEESFREQTEMHAGTS